MGQSVGRGLDPSVSVYGRHGACPPPRGRGRACPARGVSRGWAVTGGFRGVGDAAPYAGGCPLTGCRANLRRGAGTPPYGCNSRKRCRGGPLGGVLTPPCAFRDGMGLAHRRAVGAGHARPGGFPGDGRQQKVSGASGTPPPTRVGCPLTGSRANLRRGAGTPPYGCHSCKRCRGGRSLMGRFVGRGLDPSAGVCGRHGACPPPRGRGRACPARRFSRGWAAAGNGSG